MCKITFSLKWLLSQAPWHKGTIFYQHPVQQYSDYSKGIVIATLPGFPEFESSNGLDHRPRASFGAMFKPWVGRIPSREGAEIWDCWDTFQFPLVIFLCAPRLFPVQDSIIYFIQVWKIALMWLVLCFWGLFSAKVLSNWICFHIVIFRYAFYLL